MRCHLWSARVAAVAIWSAFLTSTLRAQTVALDFTTFAVENYPETSGFAEPNWVISDDGLSAGDSGNSWPTLLIGTESIVNTRITGTIYPGTTSDLLPGVGDAGGDDDIFGLALGINQGDVNNPDADFVLIDWKGVNQFFNFNDPASAATDFNNLTGETFSRAGFVISRVRGIPTSDELWGRIDLPENLGGSVTELAPANTLSVTGYNRAAGAFHEFEIIYRQTTIPGLTDIIVNVDGVQEFFARGDFSAGSIGLYESHMNAGAIFTGFQLESLPEPGDFNIDGSIDMADFQILVNNINTSGSSEDGDVNFDTKIDLNDFIEFRALFSSQAAAAVPEPSSLLLLLLGPCCVFEWRRRKCLVR